ncbi:MAG TPA: phosphoserine transaminase [Phycisphaerales bacterium]|nr:phosphoserine transaminase [Phycisphaerales bacterium]
MSTMTSPAPAKSKSGSKRIFNFSAGPAVLPEEVLKQAQEDVWNIASSGVGILEHSHRGKVYDRVIEEAEADCRKLAGISDEYYVLFLQGGATTQFAMVPMNFLSKDATADYPDTGVWTTKAIKEAKLFGNVNVAFEGSKCKYDHVPADSELKQTPNAAYLHYCSNNTIYGTEYTHVPTTSAPLVCDASSDIFSKPIDVKKHSLIYAGAQKNLGPAGTVLVIVRKDFAAKGAKNLPSMFSYQKHGENGSRLNTPPTFGIYLMGQVFKWLLKNGGLQAFEKRNVEKAKVIYDAIDGSSGYYKGVARKDSRSLMNVTFRLPNEELEAKFVKESEMQEMDGLKGHRDAGGIRASIYNAFPIEGCRALAQFMKDFAARNG